MNKKYLKIYLAILAICLISAAAFYFIYQNKKNTANKANTSTTQTKPKDLMTDEEKDSFHLYGRGIYEVVSRDASGKPNKFRLIGLERAQPIKLELMADADKLKKNVATSTKIQVLKRDKAGNIVQYRIMKDEKDILTKY